MAISYMDKKTNFRPEAIFTPNRFHWESALCIAHSPVRVTMLTETFHVHFCLVSQCPSSYLHHIFGTSLLEAICGQSSCDIGCLYGTMYARQCLPNHLNYSVDCHCTLDWLGMESSYYCTCGGTINLFRCWGEQLILMRPNSSGGLVLKYGWFCHYFVKRVLCCSNFAIAALHCSSRISNDQIGAFTWGEFLIKKIKIKITSKLS